MVIGGCINVCSVCTRIVLERIPIRMFVVSDRVSSFALGIIAYCVEALAAVRRETRVTGSLTETGIQQNLMMMWSRRPKARTGGSMHNSARSIIHSCTGSSIVVDGCRGCLRHDKVHVCIHVQRAHCIQHRSTVHTK